MKIIYTMLFHVDGSAPPPGPARAAEADYLRAVLNDHITGWSGAGRQAERELLLEYTNLQITEDKQ